MMSIWTFRAGFASASRDHHRSLLSFFYILKHWSNSAFLIGWVDVSDSFCRAVSAAENSGTPARCRLNEVPKKRTIST